MGSPIRNRFVQDQREQIGVLNFVPDTASTDLSFARVEFSRDVDLTMSVLIKIVAFEPGRGLMGRIFSGALLVTLSLSLAAEAQQSLGDIARTNREQQQAQEASGAVPKVYTNRDLPAAPPAPVASDAEPMTGVSGNSRAFEYGDSEQHFSDQRFAEQRTGQRWKGRIEAQKNRIADLQARIDSLNSMIHPSGSAQYEAPYNRSQAMQMQRLQQMQMILEQQKRVLYAMQDAARRAGMHTQVYDP
jgi:hypothetical protein